MCKINSAKSLLYSPPLQCYLYLILLEKKQYQTILKMCRSSFCTEKCIVDSRNLPIKNSYSGIDYWHVLNLGMV